jgi:hypothetical protein
MSYPQTVWQWMKEVSRRFPNLSWPQAKVLACYSLGIVLANTCGLTQVADSLAELLGEKRQTCFQRLREWRNEAGAKHGDQRQEVCVVSCFAPLLAWILSLWAPANKQLVLVLDATPVSDRFVVLSISVVLRSCAIPVAWYLQRARVKGAHKHRWLDLLERLHEAVPPDWQVVLMADRRLYAKWLYQRIEHYHWHPFLRINVGCKARLQSAKRGTPFEPIMRLVPRKGTQGSGGVHCFSSKGARLCCTLLARWEEGYQDPWFILTDLPVQQAEACWYGMRCWIECGFKDGKGGGWNWQNCRSEKPERVERMWLAMAVATLAVVGVGAEREVNEPLACLDHLPLNHVARRTARAAEERAKATANRAPSSPPKRVLSCFNRGCRLLTRQIGRLQGKISFGLPVEPWPHLPALSLEGGFWGSG